MIVSVSVPASGAYLATVLGGIAPFAVYSDAGATTSVALPYALPLSGSVTLYVRATEALTAKVVDGAGATIATAGIRGGGVVPMVFQCDRAGDGQSYETEAALSGTYATRARALSGLLPRNVTATPDVHSAPPTVTDSAAWTVTSGFHSVGCQSLTEYTALGCRPNLNATFGFVQGDISGKNADDTHIGFTLDGDTAEVQFRVFSATQRYWIFVDGKPLTAAAVAPATTTASGGSVYVKLVFATVGSYDVKIYTQSCQFYEIRTPIAQGVSPSQQRPWSVGVIADSWGASNSATGYLTLDAFPRHIGLALGCEVIQGGIPGTGYIKPGATTQPYADDLRVSAMAYLKPDLLIFAGGGNDADGVNTKAQITAAAGACYAEYAAALPQTLQVVVGQFPNNIGNATSQVFIDCANAIRSAAVSSPYVLGYVDPLGIADTGVIPSAYANATVYAVGDRALYQGGYLECTEAHTSGATPSYRRWKQLSWLYGTGRAGATTGDGNRDSFLGSDNGHPSLLGSRYLGARIAGEVVRILRQA